MSEKRPYVITISRVLGCGGSYLGQRLASRLGVVYADREIVRQAADATNVAEEIAEDLDEKLTPMWRSILRNFEYEVPEIGYVPLARPTPTDNEFHSAQSDALMRIACEKSAVIVGRGGFYLLRDNPRHLSVFLHADMEFRMQRVQDLYGVSEKQVEGIIQASDRDRCAYLRQLTKSNWTDARHYHLSLDTAALGFDGAEDIIISCLKARLGDL